MPSVAKPDFIEAIAERVVELLEQRLSIGAGKKLLNTEDVAKALKVTETTVRGLTRAGSLPVVKVGERNLRYDPAAVAEYIREHTGRG